MHAADVAESLPVAHLDDLVLSALRVVVDNGLPGLVVADETGRVVTCVSSVDLLRLALPAYMRDCPSMSWVIKEEAADRFATRLVGVSVRQVVTDTAGSVPVARAEASLVELAELMGRQGCALALVRRGADESYGVVTANRVLEALAAGAGEDPGP